jgi:hypothetical protein
MSTASTCTSWNAAAGVRLRRGAAFELLHEGAIRRDPIAIRLDDMRVALRRATPRACGCGWIANE